MSEPVKRPRNVLLITADQWRGDCLSAQGHALVQTPAVDALAARGTRFSAHYAGAAPCSPARACLYTGLYQMNNRVCMNGSPLDARHDTLALALRRCGYDPTLFGYTDQSQDPRTRHQRDPVLTTYEGFLPGFTVRASIPDHQQPYLSWLQQQGYGDLLDVENVHISPDGVDDPPTARLPRYAAEHTETAYLTDELLRWLGEQQRASRYPATGAAKRPGWCAHISFLRPHPPFVVPAPYNTMYSPQQVGEFAGGGDAHAAAALHPLLGWLFSRIDKSHFIAGAQGLINTWSQQDLRAIAAIYLGMISEVDAQIGRILQHLDALGMRDDTLIVFTSDHGEELGDHGLLGKYGFFDGSYHVPLVISDPTRAATHGHHVSEFTEAVDVLPTILEWCGSQPPAHLDGRSLLPFVEAGKPERWRQSAHWEYDFRHVSDQAAERHFGLQSTQCNLSVLRRRQCKYVHFAGLEPLLFDLSSDPQETVNVAGDPAYQALRLDCAEELLDWRAAHLDQSLALSMITRDGVVGAMPE